MAGQNTADAIGVRHGFGLVAVDAEGRNASLGDEAYHLGFELVAIDDHRPWLTAGNE